MWSWGDGSNGKLGLGNFKSEKKPCLISFLEGQIITKVLSGPEFSIAISTAGDVFSWGKAANFMVVCFS